MTEKKRRQTTTPFEDAAALFVAHRLRQLREAAGFSQATVARHIGTSQPALSFIESGKKSPGWITLARLARFYGASLGDFDMARSGGKQQ